MCVSLVVLVVVGRYEERHILDVKESSIHLSFAHLVIVRTRLHA
jgi:hypothetical protein